MRNRSAKARLARLAGRQFGLVTWAQMLALGIDRAVIHRWANQAYLHRVLPRVYAVGHRAHTVESDLMAAILYAGPGAVLSHATAAWWVGLANSRPHRIDVSTPRRCRSLPGIRIHGERDLERASHKGLPVTLFEQTMVDYASQASLTKVRLALARADHDGSLNASALASALRPGRPGTARLRTALKRHLPRLADTKSLVEATFVELCETYELPLPEVNGRVAGWEVDIVWRKQRL